jgi:UDP-N-acetylmuramate dehydrogenase
MDMSEIESVCEPTGLRGEIRMNESMSRFTSWRAGGIADRLYIPADLADFAHFLRAATEDEAVYVVGLGSNLLVRDGGVRGTVVVLHPRLNELRLEQRIDRGALIYVQAGVACAKAARFAASRDLAGAEFLASIPGTIGGALAMNAGCYGSETWDIVERVQTITRDGRTRERPPGDYVIGYRHVALKADMQADERLEEERDARDPREDEEWFTGAWFRLSSGHQGESRQRIKEFLGKRIASQPLDQPNAGSVFRNPSGDRAARLIEACGLKGFRVGGAMVSPKHANFIVNTGTATATDIETVIVAVQKAVKEKSGVELQPEVRIIGSRL